MFFWFKRSKLIVDAFTYSESAYKLFPIERATSSFPSWINNVDDYCEVNHHGVNVPVPTIKTCSGVRELYSNSFAVRYWSDIIINLTNTKENGLTYKYTFAGDGSLIMHGNRQHKMAHTVVAKILSPWMLGRANVKIMLHNPIYNDPHHKTFSGVVDLRYTSEVNWFLGLREPALGYQQDTTIKANDVAFMFTPLSDMNVIFKNHLIDKDDWIKKQYAYNSHIQPFFTNGHYKGKKILREKNKCPFGFGGK